MKTSISAVDIEKQLIRQLSSLFLVSSKETDCIHSNMPEVLARCEYCFFLTDNKYYSSGGETYFNPYQSAQYTIFLYYFSNSVFHNDPDSRLLADKLYYLNKTMNGCDLYYEVELPKFFKLDHPVGTVMGRARYGEGFSFGQSSTVGNNRGIYPVIGNNVRMCAFTSILGNCKIGDNVTIGIHSGIKDEDIPDDCLVFGYSPHLIIKHK